MTRLSLLASITLALLAALFCTSQVRDPVGPKRFLQRRQGLRHANDCGRPLARCPGVVGGSGYVDYTAYKFTSLNGHMLCCMPGGQQLTLTSIGKILVAGTAYYDANSSDMYMAVVRLNSDLSLDTGFHAVIDQNQVTFAGGARVGNPGETLMRF
jgi:hypothetical protein